MLEQLKRNGETNFLILKLKFNVFLNRETIILKLKYPHSFVFFSIKWKTRNEMNRDWWLEPPEGTKLISWKHCLGNSNLIVAAEEMKLYYFCIFTSLMLDLIVHSQQTS